MKFANATEQNEKITNLIRAISSKDSKVFVKIPKLNPDDETWELINEEHIWNFKDFDYKIESRRTLAIRHDHDTGKYSVEEINPYWTASDYGDCGSYSLIHFEEKYAEEL